MNSERILAAIEEIIKETALADPTSMKEKTQKAFVLFGAMMMLLPLGPLASEPFEQPFEHERAEKLLSAVMINLATISPDLLKKIEP